LNKILHSLRKRTHDRLLADRLSSLADSNFIVRMLFYEAYWRHCVYLRVICATFITILSLQLRFVS